MADNYRGLTIRFGGDTSRLSKALKAANGSIRETQGLIRQLDAALKLDPGSAQAAGLQVGYVAQQAENAAYKLATLRDAYDQLSEREFDGASLKQLSDETENASVRAEQAAASYDRLSSELTKMSAAITGWSDKAGLGESFSVKNDDMDDISAALDLIVEKQVVARDEADRFMSSVGKVRDAFEAAKDELGVATEISQFKQLEVEATKTNAEVAAMSRRFVELSKKSSIGQSLVGVDEEIERVSTALDAAKSRFERLDKAAKVDPNNIRFAEQRTEALAEATELARQKAELLEAKLRAYAGAEGLADARRGMESVQMAAVDATRQFAEATKQVSLLKGVLDNLREQRSVISDSFSSKTRTDDLARVESDILRTKSALAEAEAQARAALDSFDTARACAEQDELQAEIAETVADAKSLGEVDVAPKVDMAALMLAVDRLASVSRRIGQEVVQSSKEIDSAYRDMRKTVNGTEQEFEQIRKQAVEFSQTHITSADQMLEMEALAGQLGVSVKNLQEFGETAANLDIATDINADQIALQMGQITNVMSDLDENNVNQFADALVRLGNNMPAQESAIMNIAQRLSSVGNVAGMTTPEILAWSAAIASTGQRSEAAGTAISNTISGISSAVGSGGDDLEAFAKIANTTAQDFANTWNSSPTEALKQFINGLHDLNESDESAIAALEGMGITGVRQQQALLGLSQTVDNLGDAMQMSQDAWNGVADEWGAAGDAAREAEKKSEGFSGSLGKFENNASNLAATLGEGLVPILDAASGAMRVLTDILDAMPAPIKTTLVSVGGLSVLFGEVAPMAKVFGDALKSVSASLGTTTAAADGAESALSKVGSSILTGGKMAAVIYAISTLINVISDYVEYADIAYRATDGISDAMANAETSASALFASAADSITNLHDAVTSSTEALQSVADFTDEITERFTNLNVDSSSLEKYEQTIVDLADKGNLTASEIEQLKNAVSQYNEITGAAITVTDEQNGKLSVMPGTIHEITDAYREYAEVQAYIELYNEAIKEQAKVQQEHEKAARELEQSLREHAIAIGDTGYYVSTLFNEDVAAQRRLEDNEKNLQKSYDDLGEAIKGYEQKINESANGTDMSARKFSKLETALAAVGISTKELASLTREQMAQLEAAFDGTFKSVEKILAGFGIKARNAGAEISEAAQQTTKEVAAYSEEEVKARQKAFDEEYKAAQKAADQQYKLQQKSLDKAYKEAQKAGERSLKQLKSQQDEEVKQYKAATDAKLAELKREHDEKARLIDEEYGRHAGEIDERIAAIEAEADAEAEARKQKERDEKVAELQSDLNRAKSNRKRQEAQKALSDYLEKIAQEDRDAQRKAQIDALNDQKAALKQQLDDRKSTLKDSYDMAVSEYKAEREAQLALLQEANQTAYEMAQESNQAQLESLKETQAAQLESLKETQTAQLEGLKETQQAEIDAMRSATTTVTEGLGSMVGDSAEAAGAVMENFAGIPRSVQMSFDEARGIMINVVGDAEGLGNDAASGYASGISKGSYSVGEATRNVVGTFTAGTGEPAQAAAENAGQAAGARYAGGLSAEQVDAARAAGALSFAAQEELSSSSEWTRRSGRNAGINFANGLGGGDVMGFVARAAANLGSVVASFLHHSVPERGPLSDDDEWGADLVQNIVDGMRSEESRLATQARRMAEIVEGGFDPTLTVDAAYEAIDRIDAGQVRRARVAATEQPQASPGINLSISFNVPEMVIREEADLERLSNQLAAKVQRQLSSRIG